MANRRPNFEIPDVINPPNRRCIQIMIPDDNQHVAIFAGLTRQLLDWQRWERDELKRGTLVAQVWREVWNSINWSGEDCMGCCPEPTNRRYNSAGQLEVSYDGGVTWQLSPADDSRLSGSIAPPLAGADGDAKKCTGAKSVQEYVKEAFLEDLTDGATYADLNAAAVAVVAALGVTGIGVLIAAAMAAIFILGVSATVAAFTSTVWDDFRCIVYCHIEDDASFTVSGWEAVKAEILSTFTGVVSAVLYNWVNSIGVVGLTNSARSGFATATAEDCNDCECATDCPHKYTPYEGLGTILEYGDNYLIVAAHPSGYLTLKAINPDDCCFVAAIEILEGEGHGTAFNQCGEGQIPPWSHTASPVGQCATIIELQSLGEAPYDFTAKITFGDCP